MKEAKKIIERADHMVYKYNIGLIYNPNQDYWRDQLSEGL